MKYKIKEINLKKLKKYIQTDCESKSESEAKRFFKDIYENKK